jgi:tetratricopeptide (TPR) repeat protein
MYQAPGLSAGLSSANATRVTAPQSNNLDELLARACELEAAGDLPGAAATLDRLLGDGNSNPSIALLFARLAQDVGREGEALDVVLQSLDGFQGGPIRTTASLHYAAAQLLDRLGRYQEAFAQATRANAPWATAYDPARMESAVACCADLFSRTKLAGMARATHQDQTPVFIVGMPRSGSTLVEQVLASHPQVFGAGELQWINRLWQSLVSRVGGNGSLDDALARMTPADANAVAEGYLRSLRELRPGAVRVIDKNLSNFMHLGLIRALFPAARVIHCRRDPLDTCISCYMTDFAEVLPFTCSLPALGHFHGQAERLMSHWKQVLDLPILEIRYEAVVGDLEGHARQLLSFLNLPWDERCLQFHRNPRRVATASQSQVRRPLYRSSVKRWRRYEPWLGPLRNALGQ